MAGKTCRQEVQGDQEVVPNQVATRITPWLPLGFSQPWCCSCSSLPVLWWLLRLIPPQPRRIASPRNSLMSHPGSTTPRAWWPPAASNAGRPGECRRRQALEFLGRGLQRQRPRSLFLIDHGFTRRGGLRISACGRSRSDRARQTDNRGVAAHTMSSPPATSRSKSPPPRAYGSADQADRHAVERADMLVALGRF